MEEKKNLYISFTFWKQCSTSIPRNGTIELNLKRFFTEQKKWITSGPNGIFIWFYSLEITKDVAIRMWISPVVTTVPWGTGYRDFLCFVIPINHGDILTWCYNVCAHAQRECWGLDSSVGMATYYELESPGIEFRWWRYFPSRPASKPTQPSVKSVLSLFPGYVVDYPQLSRAGWQMGRSYTSASPLCLCRNVVVIFRKPSRIFLIIRHQINPLTPEFPFKF